MGNQQSLFDTLIINHKDCNKNNYHHHYRRASRRSNSYSSTTTTFSNFQSAFHFTSNSRNHNPKDCCALWKAIKSVLGIWTTGNNDIDEIIKETQRTASKHHRPWKWIPFEKFEQVKDLAKGGYGQVWSAWCTDREVYGRVALKSFEYSENMSKEFLQQLRALSKFEHSSGFIRIYGMTKNPDTNDYMLVMKYAKYNLRQYINKNFNTLTLSNKIELLVPISNGLKKIHKAGLVHGNFHPGNILQILNTLEMNNSTSKVCPMPQTWSYISDLGLRGPASNEPRKILTEKDEFVDEPDTIKDEEDEEEDDDIFDDFYFHERDDPFSRRDSVYEKPKIYGVLPYIAPEVLRGQKYTQAADIYAFGFIMYEVFMGRPPYYDVSHDLKLAQKICSGHRPLLASSDVPPRIIKLITSCWDARPEERPTALELHNMIRGWYWRLDPEMKALMRADDDVVKESRCSTPISDSSTPVTPITPTSPLNFPTTPFNTPLNKSITNTYPTAVTNISPQSTTSTMSSYKIGGYVIHSGAIYTSRQLEFDNLPQTSSWLC